MTKVNYSKRRSATVANSSQGRWLLATFATVVCCTLWAVTNGAEQVDSGWAVGIPSPFSTGERTSDPHQQQLLRRVLDESNGPLVKTVPSKSAAAAGNHEAAGPTKQSQAETPKGPRIAARPEGVDGWHTTEPEPPAKSSTPALTAPTTEQSSGPQFSAPKIPATTPKNATSSDDSECDCSGQPQHVKVEKQRVQGGLSPSLADAYDFLPSDTQSTSTATPQKQSPVQGPEHEAFDAAAAGSAASDAAAVEQRPDPAVAPQKPALNATTPEKVETSSSVKATTPVSPPTAESVAPPPLTKQLLALRTRVRAVLKGYYRKQLNSADNDPWEVMHGMLAYQLQSRIRQSGPNGNPITSVGWLCYNKPCKGQTLLYVNPEGEVRAKYGVGLQGHLGQLLAMLAQCHVSQDYPIHVGKNEFTVHDLIQAEMKTCYPKSELTFKLIALQHYIDLNEKWVNDQGVEWDFSRLMSEEMAQPIRGAACGGTHRLSGLSLTVKKRRERGEPLDGEYAAADAFVKKYQQYAFRLQNRDGSLSTQWFRGAGDEDDDDRRIKTTGHILEWLCYSLSDEELRDQRTIRAVTYLANLMYSNYDHEWEIGPRSHATHALLLYDERVFQPFDSKDAPVAAYQTPPQVAKSSQSSGTKR